MPIGGSQQWDNTVKPIWRSRMVWYKYLIKWLSKNRSILKIVNSSSTYWMCLDNKVLASSDYSNEHGKFDHPSIFLPPISLRRHLTLHLTDWISLFFQVCLLFSQLFEVLTPQYFNKFRIVKPSVKLRSNKLRIDK